MKNLFFFLILLFSFWANSQENPNLEAFRIAFYNLENLFDTIKDKGKEDYEYLPTSQKQWNTEKYNAKLHHLARAIANIGEWEGPDVLGVCEVEHQSCLEDLVNKTALKQFNYGIIHQESDDSRGIDVACLYKKDRFELIDYKYIKIDFGQNARPSRDILYVKGKPLGKDTIHIFYNHWPSRFGGASISEPKRFAAAKTVKNAVDSILMVSPKAKIIVSGDFNDGTEDLSISKYLGAEKTIEASDSTYLFNTSYHLQHELKKGTHKYQEEWNLFDQMIISSSLLDSNSILYCRQQDSFIHDNKTWLSETDDMSSGIKPFRSYIGTKYNNGYSDHYAISLILRIRQ